MTPALSEQQYKRAQAVISLALCDQPTLRLLKNHINSIITKLIKKVKVVISGHHSFAFIYVLL